MTSAPAIYALTAARSPSASDRKRAAITRAAEIMHNDTAVILGVECDPYSGMVYELAAINTRRQILLDTLVNPGMAIGRKNLTDQMLAGAPTFGQVLADLLVQSKNKIFATYSSANFSAVLSTAHRQYRDADRLDDPANWYLVAQARSDWLGEPSHYLLLQPYHRALSEAHAALNVLAAIAGDQL